MSSFKEALSSGRFIVTGEVAPPKGTNLSSMLKHAEVLRECVDAINVTDNQRAVMRMGSLAGARILLDNGLEPIFQLTCRDRNRIALQSDILSASAMGIKNILCLTGDHPKHGDHKGARAVFDLDAVSLLWAADHLRGGYDLAGKELDGTPELFLGAAVNPGADPIEPQREKMHMKIDVGAEFFQSQAVFDSEVFNTYRASLKSGNNDVNAKFLVGILLVKSAKMANFLNKSVPGLFVPDDMVKRFESATTKQERQKAAIEVAAETITGIRDTADGIHIMALGWDELIPEILDRAGIPSRSQQEE